MRKFVLTFFLLSQPNFVYAQVGTMNWRFHSVSEVTPALKKTRGNLRQTYEVITCATRQGFGTTTANFYGDIVLGHEFDASPQDSAAYAFAFDLNDTFRPWNWKRDPNMTPVKGGRMQAQFFRERALTLRSSNPEILVMRSFWGSYGTKEIRQDAYESALRAVKGTRSWADAYYALGCAANNYGICFQVDQFPISTNPDIRKMRYKLGRTAMLAFDQAEKLDPALKPNLYLQRLTSCELIADKKSAHMIPIYVEAHLKAFPNYSSWLQNRWKETESQFRGRYEKLSSLIIEKAEQ